MSFIVLSLTVSSRLCFFVIVLLSTAVAWNMTNHIILPVQLVLDQYLAPIEEKANAKAEHHVESPYSAIGQSIESANHQQLAKERQQAEILRTVHFLYGNTLEGALAILDAVTVDVTGSITRLISIPSQRSLYQQQLQQVSKRK
jgi:hypothetical protein